MPAGIPNWPSRLAVSLSMDAARDRGARVAACGKQPVFADSRLFFMINQYSSLAALTNELENSGVIMVQYAPLV